MAASRNFNGLASWRNVGNNLQSVNLTIPSPVRLVDDAGTVTAEVSERSVLIAHTCHYLRSPKTYANKSAKTEQEGGQQRRKILLQDH